MTDVPEENNALAQCWGRVTQRMRRDIGDAAWRNWIKPLRVNRLEAGTLTLETDSTLTRERVNIVTKTYLDLFKARMMQVTPLS